MIDLFLQLQVMGKNSTNKDDCCENNDYSSIYTNFIGNPDGPFQIFDDVLPNADSTYNIGSNALRWLNGYYSLSLYTPQIVSPITHLTLDAATGFDIINNKSIVPSVDIAHSCGTPSKRWLNVRTRNLLVETVLTPTGSDLLLSPATGQLIKNTVTIQPSADITTDLGTASFRYANVYGQTINNTTLNTTTINSTTVNGTTGNITNTNTNTVNATTGNNLSLTAPSGFVITASQNIEPSADSTKNLGSSSKKWQTTYTNNVIATTVNTGSVVTNSVSANPTVDLSLFADAGKSVILNNSLLPVTDNTIPLGSATKQWSDIRATQSTISSMNATTLTINNTITTPTGIDLYLSAATGRDIVTLRSIRPQIDVTHNCGTVTERWLNLHAETVNTNTVVAPLDSHLTLSPPTGKDIIASKSLRPSQDITHSCGVAAQRWLNTHTQTTTTDKVTTPAATDLRLEPTSGRVISTGDVYPSTDNTKGLGAPTQRWQAMYAGFVDTTTVYAQTIATNTGFDLTIQPATGQSIIAGRNVLPGVDATYNLGSASKQWNNCFAVTQTLSTLKSPTGTDLTLDPPTTRNLVSTKSFLPQVTATHSLGSASLTWNNGYIDNTFVVTETVTTIKSPAATNLTLDPPTGQSVVATKSIIPSANTVHNVGSPAFYWLNGYIDNISTNIVTATNFYKSPANKQGTSFNTTAPTLLTDTAYATAAISINASDFQGTSNSFKFPVTGVYLIDFTSKADNDTLSGNTIVYRIKNTVSGGVNEPLYHRIGDAYTYPPPTYRLSFLYRCNDTADRVIIERYRSSANVSNWEIVEGYCYRVNTFT